MIYFKSNILPIIAIIFSIIVISYSITGRTVLQYQIENGLVAKLTLEQADSYLEDVSLVFFKYLGSIARIIHDVDKLSFKLQFNCPDALIRFKPSNALSNIFLLVPYQLLTQYYIDINAP
ncbi:hypothetical protein QM480_19155 [Flectobacillus sp. DC10W]|uniref:Uncharacterized protein n=1 Tax=Flectobacillus longus TaxID=2984207 RepID=A0ABT6YS96_9BACT|nr:hypothetical protein [Flectobacillus longus]MDI9866468.1 hypothetical protein [Flectobacillus longus]